MITVSLIIGIMLGWLAHRWYAETWAGNLF